ncbi:MAG: hypothetical protein FRX48_09748 [Lasallia pustulata]|uniref:Uncharacterized protein n=1 Tax=Lasallia pustulata TaxID=136370 RepID=A0A5M8PB25_9LECA|nr:MAG: hypothetical protein FRX48_09748 [Lasallia pustulata]
MRLPALTLLTALAFTGFTTPSPASASIQLQSSTNNPLIKARTLPHPGQTVWSAPSSRTTITISVIRHIAGPGIPTLLADAQSAIATHIRDFGDGLITGGFWEWSAGPGGLVLNAMNANNHQTTWGVLGAAVGALMDWIEKGAVARGGEVGGVGGGVGGGPGAAYFEIWDGGIEVGVGQVG